MEREMGLAAPVSIATGTVPEGWVADFLTGKHVRDTPEEYVRQNLEKALVRQYKFEARDCQPEFPIKVGSARKRVDVVVFPPGAPHRQEHAYILVETKRAGTSPSSKTEGVDQLRSYLAACLNARYGEDVPLAVGFGWGLHDGSYGQAVTARSSRPGSSAVARSSAPASWGSSW
jgi:hypothetical protein